MALVTRVQEYGNQLKIIFDDNTVRLAYPTTGGLWIVGHPDGGTGGPIIPPLPPVDGSNSPSGGPPLGNTVIYPCTEHGVSDTFQIHVNRGSINPGTDYVAAFGSNVWAVASGTVTDAQPNYDGGGGMTIHIDNDDGTGADYLHLHQQNVAGGYHVNQGDLIAVSGGSGYGSEHYYGAHLHISYRPMHGHIYNGWTNGVGSTLVNEDFDAIVRAEHVLLL